MNRSKTATPVKTHFKSLTFIGMAGILFAAWAPSTLAADRGSAKKDLIEAHKQWVQEVKDQCRLADGEVKDSIRCKGAKLNLVKIERQMTEQGITFEKVSSQLLNEYQGAESNDPKVLHEIIRELKAKNKALKAQASGICSAASQTERDIKKNTGLGGNSTLGQQGDDEDLANRHHGRALR